MDNILLINMSRHLKCGFDRGIYSVTIQNPMGKCHCFLLREPLRCQLLSWATNMSSLHHSIRLFHSGDGMVTRTWGTRMTGHLGQSETHCGWVEIPWFPASMPILLSQRVYSALPVLDASAPSEPGGTWWAFGKRKKDQEKKEKVIEEWGGEKKREVAVV